MKSLAANESPLRGLAYLLRLGSERQNSPRHARLSVHAAAVVALGVLLPIIWAATTRAFFWPSAALIPLVVSVMIHAWVVLVLERPDLQKRFLNSRQLALQAGISASLWLYLFALWAVGSRGYFWPAWPLLALAILFGVHALEVVGRNAQTKS